MASSDLLPRCSACRRSLRYGGPLPYLLPCLHSVCDACLNQSEKSIECRKCEEIFCKCDHIFLKDTVTQNDILVSTLKTNPSEIKCTNQSHENVAAAWCMDCQIFFCKECEASHNQVKNSQDHEIILVKELPSRRSLSSKSYCPEHETYVLNLYDVTCEILICPKCHRDEHKACQTEEVNVAGREQKDGLEKDQLDLEQKLQHAHTRLTESKKNQTKLNSWHANMKRNLSNYFDNLRSLVTEREQELLKELEQGQKEIKDEMKRTMKTQEATIEKLKVAYHYTKKMLSHGDPENILVSKGSVKKRANICLSKDEEEKKSKFFRPEIAFSEDVLDEFKMMVSSIGEVDFVEEDINSLDLGIYMNTGIDLDLLEPAVTDLEEESKDDKGNSTVVRETVAGADTDPIYGNLTVPVCPKLTFDIERVNTQKVYINNEGFLVNSKLQDGKAFNQYVGTTSVTSLPDSELVYWEVNSFIEIDQQILKYGLLMEVGVAGREDMDKQYCVSGQPSSRCLSIVHCAHHKGICAKIWNHGSKTGCTKDALFNESGETFSLKHGILFDGKNNALVFIDLKKMKVIEVLKGEEQPQQLWPIFGVYNPTLARVKMSLVSGNDVEFNDEKLSLLERALCDFV